MPTLVLRLPSVSVASKSWFASFFDPSALPSMVASYALHCWQNHFTLIDLHVIKKTAETHSGWKICSPIPNTGSARFSTASSPRANNKKVSPCHVTLVIMLPPPPIISNWGRIADSEIKFHKPHPTRFAEWHIQRSNCRIMDLSGCQALLWNA